MCRDGFYHPVCFSFSWVAFGLCKYCTDHHGKPFGGSVRLRVSLQPYSLLSRVSFTCEKVPVQTHLYSPTSAHSHSSRPYCTYASALLLYQPDHGVQAHERSEPDLAKPPPHPPTPPTHLTDFRTQRKLCHYDTECHQRCSSKLSKLSYDVIFKGK